MALSFAMVFIACCIGPQAVFPIAHRSAWKDSCGPNEIYWLIVNAMVWSCMLGWFWYVSFLFMDTLLWLDSDLYRWGMVYTPIKEQSIFLSADWTSTTKVSFGVSYIPLAIALVKVAVDTRDTWQKKINIEHSPFYLGLFHALAYGASIVLVWGFLPYLLNWVNERITNMIWLYIGVSTMVLFLHIVLRVIAPRCLPMWRIPVALFGFQFFSDLVSVNSSNLISLLSLLTVPSETGDADGKVF